MRGPSREDLQNTPPPILRTSSKTTQAYLEMRRKILTEEYATGQVLIPRHIEEEYQVNNTTTQVLLARLANEGLVRVFPIKERTWPSNASLNEYRVADLTDAHKTLLIRQGTAHLEHEEGTPVTEREILLLKIQYADAEIAQFLALETDKKVVAYRERQRQADHTIVAISDWYFPFWFAEVLPELEHQERDIFSLLQQMGKYPATCSETLEVVQARSLERVLFELSPDDPAPLFKLRQHLFDPEGQPLAVQFLTAKGDHYRFQYAFSCAPTPLSGT